MRPKGWTGYHCEELCIDCDTNPVDCNKVYEAGADAMLEGLKKDPMVMLHISYKGDDEIQRLIEDYYKE